MAAAQRAAATSGPGPDPDPDPAVVHHHHHHQPWGPLEAEADPRILRVYLEVVTPHNRTFEPHFEVYRYLEWIRNDKITQNPVVNSQNY